METVKINPWFVTGLAERAGSFTYSRSGITLAMYFAIKLPQDESSLLDALASFFGGGTVYTVNPVAGAGPAASYLRFCRQADLRRVIEHFDRYALRGPRKDAYAIWREMVLLKAASGRSQPWDRLHTLAERLTRASRSSRAKSAGSARHAGGDASDD